MPGDEDGSFEVILKMIDPKTGELIVDPSPSEVDEMEKTVDAEVGATMSEMLSKLEDEEQVSHVMEDMIKDLEIQEKAGKRAEEVFNANDPSFNGLSLQQVENYFYNLYRFYAANPPNSHVRDGMTDVEARSAIDVRKLFSYH